jgi:hypothetical protein
VENYSVVLQAVKKNTTFSGYLPTHLTHNLVEYLPADRKNRLRNMKFMENGSGFSS